MVKTTQVIEALEAAAGAYPAAAPEIRRAIGLLLDYEETGQVRYLAAASVALQAAAGRLQGDQRRWLASFASQMQTML